MSRAVREALGHEVGNKTLEGYPGRRFHGGGAYVDVVERLAIERAKELFGAAYANVQPHSGTQANQAVFFALLKPGDRILSLNLTAGGQPAVRRDRGARARGRRQGGARGRRLGGDQALRGAEDRDLRGAEHLPARDRPGVGDSARGALSGAQLRRLHAAREAALGARAGTARAVGTGDCTTAADRDREMLTDGDRRGKRPMNGAMDTRVGRLVGASRAQIRSAGRAGSAAVPRYRRATGPRADR